MSPLESRQPTHRVADGGRFLPGLRPSGRRCCALPAWIFLAILGATVGAPVTAGDRFSTSRAIPAPQTDLVVYTSVCAADLDGDRDLDVVSASPGNRVAWYENLGSASTVFTARDVSASTGAFVSVHPADLDGDGDIDVVSGSYDRNTAICRPDSPSR